MISLIAMSVSEATARPAAAERIEAPPVQKLRALVLLGGSISPTSLSAQLGLGMLQLPVEQECKLMDHWWGAATELAAWAGSQTLKLRVQVDQSTVVGAAPAAAELGIGPRAMGGVSMCVERDPVALRGTGGVLRDLADEYADDDYLVVASAGQLLTRPLVQVVKALLATGAETALVSHGDGTPSGMMIIKCACLRRLPEVGFIDLKEQGLPRIAARHEVIVKRYRHPVGLSVRTLPAYISALRWWHQAGTGGGFVTDPFAEDWQPAFSVVEPGAEVDRSAVMHDSVVLAGARVERGAVLIRSVVAAGGVVRRNSRIVDQVVREII